MTSNVGATQPMLFVLEAPSRVLTGLIEMSEGVI